MAAKKRKKAKAVTAKKTKRKPAKAVTVTKKAKKAKKVIKAKGKKKPAKAGVVKTVKKAAARLVAAAKRTLVKAPKQKEVLGEGNYTASRNFRKKETDYIQHNRATIARKAKEAEAAIDGPEGAELEQAREETAAHAKE
jgi:hypothetical protein